MILLLVVKCLGRPFRIGCLQTDGCQLDGSIHIGQVGMESDGQQACCTPLLLLPSFPPGSCHESLHTADLLCGFASQGCVLMSKALNSVLIPDMTGGVYTGGAPELCPTDLPRVTVCVSIHFTAPLSWPNTLHTSRSPSVQLFPVD